MRLCSFSLVTGMKPPPEWAIERAARTPFCRHARAKSVEGQYQISWERQVRVHLQKRYAARPFRPKTVGGPLLFRGQRLYFKQISAEKRGAGYYQRLLDKKRQAAPPWENHGGALVSTGMRKSKTAGRGAAGLVKSGNKSNWQRLRIRLRCLIKQRRDACRRLMSALTGHTYQAGDPMMLAATGPRNFRRAGRGTPWQRAKPTARTNLGLRP